MQAGSLQQGRSKSVVRVTFQFAMNTLKENKPDPHSLLVNDHCWVFQLNQGTGETGGSTSLTCPPGRQRDSALASGGVRFRHMQDCSRGVGLGQEDSQQRRVGDESQDRQRRSAMRLASMCSVVVRRKNERKGSWCDA